MALSVKISLQAAWNEEDEVLEMVSYRATVEEDSEGSRLTSKSLMLTLVSTCGRAFLAFAILFSSSVIPSPSARGGTVPTR